MTAFSLAGGASLTEDQKRQLAYQKELQAMHEFILAQQKAKAAPPPNAKKARRNKYDYDSDEETEGGTWEHRARLAEMEATKSELWGAEEL